MTPATARRIVTHPEQHSASLRLLAWCALKSGRGQPVRQSVLNRRADDTTAALTTI